MEGESIPPGKRKKVDDHNDLQKLLQTRDKAIEELTAENEKLRKKVDELVNTMHSSFFMKNITSDDDIHAEELQERNQAKKRKNRKNKIPTVKDAVTNGNPNIISDGPMEGINADNTTDFSDAENERNKSTPRGTATSNGMKVPETVESKSRQIPVITTYNINVKEMTDLIDGKLGHKNYNLRIMGKNATNIGVCTLVDFEAVKFLLREKGVNFYTYTPRGQKPFSVVIEGLSGTYTEEDILDYLRGLGIKLNILGLVKLNGDRWLLRLSRESDLSAFYSLRYVLRCRVRMRKYKRGVITQCFNCQRFGHVSTNCQMPYRCVKCGASHGPGKCDIPKKGENTKETLVTDPVTGQAVRKVGLPVRCVNCGVEGHAASSRECPRRVELLRKVERKRAERVVNDKGRRPAISMVRPGVSYASAAASGGSRGVTGKPGSSGPGVAEAFSEFNLIDGDCKRFFGGGLLSCLGRIGGFAREYRGLRDDESKSRALLGMLMLLRQDD